MLHALLSLVLTLWFNSYEKAQLKCLTQNGFHLVLSLCGTFIIKRVNETRQNFSENMSGILFVLSSLR